MKPHNIVNVTLELTWKLIDMATATEDGEDTAIHYTLRCLTRGGPLKPRDRTLPILPEDSQNQVSNKLTKPELPLAGRYAAPEVVQAVMNGKATMVCSVASDMWSFGVIMYELYVGRRLFDDSLPEEEIVALLCSVSTPSLLYCSTALLLLHCAA